MSMIFWTDLLVYANFRTIYYVNNYYDKISEIKGYFDIFVLIFVLIFAKK